MKLKLISTSYHRNGVCGEPFSVSLIEDEDGSLKVCVDFGDAAFAVLQVDKLAAGDIAFGSNSWRGDRYAETVRALAENADLAHTNDSFFVVYKKRKATEL